LFFTSCLSLASADTITWDGNNSNASSAWISTANWNPDSTLRTGGAPTASNIAQFAGTGLSSSIGINFNGTTNHGAAAQIVGQILQSGGASRTIGSSTSTVDGVLTIAGVGGSLIVNSSANHLTLAPNVGSATKLMQVQFGSAGDIEVSGAGTVVISSVIGGGHGFTKTGSGTMLLTGANIYTGDTTVNTGVLQVGNGGAGSTGIGTVNVATGATIFGSGTLRGNTGITHTFAGTVRPGDQATGATPMANMNVEGNLVFTPVSTSFFEIGNPASSYDRITGTVAGTTATLDGTIKVDFSGYTPTGGESWQLFDWSSLLTTSFNVGTATRTGANGVDEGDLDLPDVGSLNLLWDLSSFASSGTISLAVVPEPSVPAFLALGTCVCIVRRRVRKN
jgi:fibronectin-binding autotransporter adhesin